jgi:hypothetical protein
VGKENHPTIMAQLRMAKSSLKPNIEFLRTTGSHGLAQVDPDTFNAHLLAFVRS